MFWFATDAATATADNAHWTAIGAAVVAILTAAGTLYSLFRKEKRADDSAVIKEFKSIIGRHEKQINRQQTLIDNYDRIINDVREDHAKCQLRLSDYYGWILRYHDWMTRQAEFCRTLGHDPGDLPDVPPHPLKDSEEALSAADFAAKTVAQGKTLIREIDDRNVATNIHSVPPPLPPLDGRPPTQGSQ